jgi:hypothetical protein
MTWLYLIGLILGIGVWICVAIIFIGTLMGF